MSLWTVLWPNWYCKGISEFNGESLAFEKSTTLEICLDAKVSVLLACELVGFQLGCICPPPVSPPPPPQPTVGTWSRRVGDHAVVCQPVFSTSKSRGLFLHTQMGKGKTKVKHPTNSYHCFKGVATANMHARSFNWSSLRMIIVLSNSKRAVQR